MGTQANRSLKVWPGNSDVAGHFTAYDRLTLGLLFDTALEEAKAGDASRLTDFAIKNERALRLSLRGFE